MASDNSKANDSILVRWLAISGAAGAAIASGLASWKPNQIWQSVALVAALLAVAGVAGLWRAFAKRDRDLAAVSDATGDQKREMSALQEELAVQRELERELTLAKQTAEAAMMAKGEFLATMSHEIRTPLNGIIPMLDIMMTAPLAPDHKDVIRTAYTSAKQLLRIVDDILDYSKLEANKLTLETTTFNIRELCDSIILLMERAAESKGLRLSLQIDSNVRLPVRGDPVRLRQVLTNLLSNAIKFTERGTVQLLVTRRSESRTQHELRIEVRDTGIGISKLGIQQLFRPFSQADASTTRLYGGTGLGLVICKRIIDLMGGTMGVDSEPGRGSSFWLNVPFLKASGDVQGQRSDLNGARILLLSNDQGIRQRLKPAAVAWGAQLGETDSTQDALTQLRTGITRGGTWAYDLLLVDMNSVRSTAIALHRNLRRSSDLDDLRVVYLVGNEELPDELKSTPQYSFAITRMMAANEMRTAITQFLSARPAPDSASYQDDHAPTPDALPVSAPASAAPVTPAQSANPAAKTAATSTMENPFADIPLFEMHDMALSAADGNAPAAAVSPTAPAMPTPAASAAAATATVHSPAAATGGNDPANETKKLRGHLLLVEDNPVNMMVAQRLISMLGLQCETAENGQLAIDRMLSGHLDLVLMDCQMPVKDGYTATQEWRIHEANTGQARLPIVAMTANAMAGDRQKCLDAGMDDYITKPVDRRILESTLARWLQAKNDSSDIAQHSSVTPSNLPPSAPAAAAPVAQAPAVAIRTVVDPPIASTAPPLLSASAPSIVQPRVLELESLPPPLTTAPNSAPAPAATPPAVASPPPAPASPPPSVNPLPVLAPEIIEELRAMMGDEYSSLVKLFLEDAPKQIAQLEEAAASNNILGMIGPAHTLKASSANLGALALAAIAKRIELGARASALLRPTVAVLLLSEEYKKAKLALQALVK
jgi:signal transduction histidine kinase/DNA-binding response OmpR family regulator/HPt (histidine-containing phosphotransfer) domain-containing protein